MISDNVEFLQYCGGHFENGGQLKFFNGWSYRYMVLVDPKVFRFVVKEVKAIFLGVQRGRGLL
jgi:hypothetical protein